MLHNNDWLRCHQKGRFIQKPQHDLASFYREETHLPLCEIQGRVIYLDHELMHVQQIGTFSWGMAQTEPNCILNFVDNKDFYGGVLSESLIWVPGIAGTQFEKKILPPRQAQE
jgi:hypothetical protein